MVNDYRQMNLAYLLRGPRKVINLEEEQEKKITEVSNKMWELATKFAKERDIPLTHVNCTYDFDTDNIEITQNDFLSKKRTGPVKSH